MVRGAKRRGDGPPWTACITHEALIATRHFCPTLRHQSRPIGRLRVKNLSPQSLANVKLYSVALRLRGILKKDFVKPLPQASLNTAQLHVASYPCHPKRETCKLIALRTTNIRLLSQFSIHPFPVGKSGRSERHSESKKDPKLR